MPIVTLNVSQVIGKTLQATGNVPYYYPVGTQLGTFTKGQTIGVIYSYVFAGTPNLYWMVERGPNNYVFVKHDVNTMTIANGKQLLEDIQKQKDKAEYEEKGALRYYIEKYVPWLVGGAVVVMVAPTVLNFIQNRKK